MKNSKPIVVDWKIFVLFVLLTILLALWGFANDITNPMVAALKTVMEISNAKAALVQFAFYGSYVTFGAAGLVMVIVGGALMPPLQARIIDVGGSSFNDIQIMRFISEMNSSFILSFICFVVITIYCLLSYKDLKII